MTEQLHFISGASAEAEGIFLERVPHTECKSVVGYWWELLVTGTNIFGTGTSISRDNIFLLSSNRRDSWRGPLTLQGQRKRADHCSPLEGAIP